MTQPALLPLHYPDVSYVTQILHDQYCYEAIDNVGETRLVHVKDNVLTLARNTEHQRTIEKLPEGGLITSHINLLDATLIPVGRWSNTTLSIPWHNITNIYSRELQDLVQKD